MTKAEYGRQWRAENQERVKELKRRWREANPDKVKEHKRKSAIRNRAHLRVYDRERRVKDPEKFTAYNREYREKNREKLRETQRQWVARNKEIVKAYKRKSGLKYRKAHPERKKAHYALRNAIRHGTLIRQPCIKCGQANGHAHHPDYSKPLEVEWLCKVHHEEIHRDAAIVEATA